MSDDLFCPCGSGQTFADCCGPFLSGVAFPPTAEALMRSRFSAYVRVAVPYLVATVASAQRMHHRAADIRDWAEEAQWLRLEVVDRVAGGPGDDTGVVEFHAWYTDKQGLQRLQERSQFVREDGQWRYLKGTHDDADWRKQIGRNDPCPCGSGRKWKKCHG